MSSTGEKGHISRRAAKMPGRAVKWAVRAAVLLALAFLLCLFVNSRGTYHFSSQLLEALSIAELSTSELIYNGIVDVYDDDGSAILYSAKYNATIKVGIAMEDVTFAIDPEHKTVTPVLPELTILSPIVDPASIDYIPKNLNVDLKHALKACKDDAQREAEQSDKLIETAEENLKSIIGALTHPIASDAGYRVVW